MAYTLIVWIMLGFGILNTAVYVGTLRALEIYFDPQESSYSLLTTTDRQTVPKLSVLIRLTV
jgi:hypothetical protein